MNQYALVDWELVRSTPLKHTYRCDWRRWLAGQTTHSVSPRPWWRQVTIEWDGQEQLLVRTGILWRRTRRFDREQVKNVTFGLREIPADEQTPTAPSEWLWYIQLTGKRTDTQGSSILAEFYLAHQYEPPSTSRAIVPARVQELLSWLGHCTKRRPHGPTLVTDEARRQRILSHVD